MKYYSTNNKGYSVDLKTAVLKSLPPDNGLYMPERIGRLDDNFFNRISELSFQDIAFSVAQVFLGEDIDDGTLRGIVTRAINFEAPLHHLTDSISTLELWHGPSLAFKDFGARFMAELMSYLVKDDKGQLSILVATSGDTGGAVAAGFYGVPNIDVTILYPKGKVSPLQELQLTTWGGNISALEIDGTFDDCQALVKTAFLDETINKKHNLSSANSINIARLIPQSFYYFESFKQRQDRSKELVFAVPSGNFGNLTAGILAKRMGLPVSRFLAATNSNNIVPHYLATNSYEPRPSIQTISNAMDVGKPSNFSRMIDLYGNNWDAIRADIEGFYYDDEETRFAVKYIHKTYDYVADPHGAIGFLAAHQYLQDNPNLEAIFLETAHPAKFLPVMNPLLGDFDIPTKLSDLREKEKNAQSLSKEFATFKSYLLDQ